MNREHITAIVLAAGKGSRMQSEIPKQYLEVDGKPLLYYSLKCFEESSVNDIILVTGEKEILYCKENIQEKYSFNKIKKIVAGGCERYWSVKNGLDAAEGADYVLIHDGARPCLSVELIEQSINEVKKSKACTLGVPVKDTIKLVDENGYGIETPPRKYLWQVQTPQSFCYADIVAAYNCLGQMDGIEITDDTMILEQCVGVKTKLIYGSYSNIKVTTPEDLSAVEKFCNSSAGGGVTTPNPAKK